MLRGRVLSLTLLTAGALCVSAGAALATAVLLGVLLGVAVGVVVLGLQLLAAGLFLVPVTAPPEDTGQPGLRLPIHGVVP